MVTVMDAIKAVEKKDSGISVGVVMDFPKSYIVSFMSKGGSMETSVDNFYSVDKNNGRISEYSPLFDLEEFKKYKDNVVYRRK